LYKVITIKGNYHWCSSWSNFASHADLQSVQKYKVHFKNWQQSQKRLPTPRKITSSY